MARKLLITFLTLNSFIIALGIIMFIFSCIILSNIEEFDNAVKGIYKVAPVILVIVGVVISTMAVIGIFASIDKKSKYLCGYIIALVTSMVLQLVAVSLVFYSEAEMSHIFQEKKVPLKLPSLYLQDLQIKRKCCGYYTPADYNGGDEPYKLPPSCCPGNPSNCEGSSNTTSNAYSEGCRAWIIRYHKEMCVGCGVTASLNILISIILIIIIDKMGRIPVTIKGRHSLTPSEMEKVEKQEEKLEKENKEEADLKI